MTVSELISMLQKHDPGAEVVTRGIDYLDEVIRVSELSPVKLRAFAAEGCAWFEYWADLGPPADNRTTIFSEPVNGLLLE